MKAGALAGAVVAVMAVGCANPIAPSATPVDVLDFVIGAPETWPRHGSPNHHQHQVVDAAARRVWFMKYTLPWSYETWRWDDQFIYHETDHAIDGARRWEFYRFSDGRWLPRHLTPGVVWSLTLADNRVTWFDADCQAQPEQPAPYRVSAWLVGRVDAGGDLGVRDVLVLAYEPNVFHADPASVERFYFAQGAGWYRWTRGTAEVTFNEIGGVARTPAPLCARDFQG